MNVSRTLLAALAALTLSTSLSSATAATYTVKAGDTLASIAAATHQEQTSLMRMNGLQSPTVAEGQVLNISGFAAAPQAAAATPVTATPVTATKAGPAVPAAVSAKAQAKSASSGGAYIQTAASRFLGIRYVHGGTGNGGIDCSGFTMRVFQQMGIRLPRTAAAQYRTGSPVSSRNLRAGDLVFFNTMGTAASHVGIYLGGGMMANANSYYGRTMVEPLFSNPYWASRYSGARRVLS